MRRLTRWIIGAPRLVLSLTLLLLAICGFFGIGAAERLLAGGFEDPGAESSRGAQLLEEHFDRGGLQLIVKLDAPEGTDIRTDATAQAVADRVVADLAARPYVQQPILTVWNSPTMAGDLVSEDGSSTQILAGLAGGEELAPTHAAEISEQLTGVDEGIRVSVAGEGLVFHQINSQTSRDLLIAEAVAIPISFVLLIVIFGGLLAAAVPLIIGIVSIVGTLALLRLITEFADVSIFALNLATALGLALAIDYTLLILTRYREEVAAGKPRDEAILRTVETAGRTVVFSAVTVGLSMAALAIFPMYFLRSFAYAGVGVVLLAVAASILVTPALLILLGDRIDSLDIRKAIRRALGLPAVAPPKPVERTGWYRIATWVLRHAAPVAIVVTAVLIVLGLPFSSIKFGMPDDRVLPESASAHAISEEIRVDYAQNPGGTSFILVDGPVSDADLAGYVGRLSEVDGVALVASPVGGFADGSPVLPPTTGDVAGDVRILTVSTAIDPLDDAGQRQVDELRAVTPPDGVTVHLTGLAAVNADLVDSIFGHLPWVLLIIAISTYILLFLFTGSVVLPLKALLLNVLSLSVTFGAMVWIFQEGHLGGFDTTPLGYLVATMPVLMFCIAFGLSMDYEVFLLGRIREEWLASGQTRADNDRAVAIGLARTGRVVTAAALLMAIVFAGIAVSEVSFMRMFGVGLVLAVLMDATVIRMLLVPAFMRLAGRWNWWAPGPLRRLHDRIGLSEEGPPEPAPTAAATPKVASDV